MSTTSNGALVPAVGYARCSTTEQEFSIPEQKAAVERYAAEKGYKLLRWYEDDGISGDDTDRRLAFLRMTDDVRDRRDFKTILCWDRKRFGRFDSLEYGYHVHPLRKAGVALVTVTDGAVDWNDPMMRMVSTFTQEGAHKDLVDHSANVTRNQRGAMLAGSWVGCSAYGYRLAGAKKAKRLVLGEPAHVRTVQRIYDLFARQGRSMNAIAGLLNADGVPSPRGQVKGWHPDTVKGILANPAYAGDFAAGRYTYGKYHTAGRERVEKGAGRGRKSADQWFVRRDHHEAIVDRPTWDRAQEILARGKTGRSPYQPGENPYLLSGKLRCGLCDGPMQGKSNGGARYYECSRRAHDLKRTRDGVCEGTTVKEYEVMESLADFLDGYLGEDKYYLADVLEFARDHGDARVDPRRLSESFHKIKALFATPAVPRRDRNRLEARRKELEKVLAGAQAKLIHIEPDNLAAYQLSIRQHRDELAEVNRELEEAKPVADEELTGTAVRVAAGLFRLAHYCRVYGLRDAAQHADWLKAHASEPVARFLGQTAHVKVYTEKTGKGVRRRHTFTGGEILISVAAVTGRVNPSLSGRYTPARPRTVALTFPACRRP